MTDKIFPSIRRRLSLIVLLLSYNNNGAQSLILRSPIRSRSAKTCLHASNYYNSGDGIENQALEALQSLGDFHEGQWRGQARSFSISTDTAAGILQRSASPPYTASVKLGMDLTNRDYRLTETIEWEDKVSARTLSLEKSNSDVDTVDASFSLDMTLPTLPSALLGTEQLPQFLVEHCIALNDDERAKCWIVYGVDQSLLRVVLCHETRSIPTKGSNPEESLDTNNDNKMNSGGDSLTAVDLLEMQTDVDRLVDKIAGNLDNSETQKEIGNTNSVKSVQKAKDFMKAVEDSISKNSNKSMNNNDEAFSTTSKLTRHGTNLLEVSSGVWLGDIVVRDKPLVSMFPRSLERGRGFGRRSSSGTTTDGGTSNIGNSGGGGGGFAQWSIGVQKAAWRWMWNFGEEIRQVTEYGRGMGSQVLVVDKSSDDCFQSSLSGIVCVNEGLSRRTPRNERMVYIDWNNPSSSSSTVAFVVDSFLVQAPRYLSFGGGVSSSLSSSSSTRPFTTEFGVCQRSYQDHEDSSSGVRSLLNTPSSSLEKSLDDLSPLPEVVCSKLARTYNFEGLLKQGCSSFYTLKRFESDKE